MNITLKLGRSFAGLGILGLAIAGASQLPTSNSQTVVRKVDLPLLAPIVSSELTSDRGDISNTAVGKEQPSRLNSAQIALKQAQVAVSLSQTQLAQARKNLIEFQAKHDNAKILSEQGKVSRKQAALAVAAYKLAQLQHGSAEIGLKDSTAQLVIARAEVCKLGHKTNSATEM